MTPFEELKKCMRERTPEKLNISEVLNFYVALMTMTEEQKALATKVKEALKKEEA